MYQPKAVFEELCHDQSLKHGSLSHNRELSFPHEEESILKSGFLGPPTKIPGEHVEFLVFSRLFLSKVEQISSGLLPESLICWAAERLMAKEVGWWDWLMVGEDSADLLVACDTDDHSLFRSGKFLASVLRKAAKKAWS